MIEIDIRHRQGAFELAAAFTSSARLTALFGPSGSGKSTLIALVAGLIRPDSGRIVVDGRVLVDTAAGVFLRPHRRRVGLVFQDAQLFPHFTVAQNLAFGGWFAPSDAPAVDRDAVIGTLGIEPLLGRRPATLSGGERQRVAIGRALLARPRLVLMDEPLASLDMARRLEILPLIERLRDAVGVPIVYVSHTAEEVARLAATVVMLDGGRLVAAGPPAEVLGIAAAGSGGRFETMSVIEGQLGPVDPTGLTPVLHPSGTIWLAGRLAPTGRTVRLVLRGTDIALATKPPDGLSIRTMLEGVVAAVVTGSGPHATVELTLTGGDRLAAVLTRRAVEALKLRPGTPVVALVKSVALDERGLGEASAETTS